MKRITVTVEFALEVPDNTNTEAVTMDFDRCTGTEVGFDDYEVPDSNAPKKTAKLLAWTTTYCEEGVPPK